MFRKVQKLIKDLSLPKAKEAVQVTKIMNGWITDLKKMAEHARLVTCLSDKVRTLKDALLERCKTIEDTLQSHITALEC